MKPLLQQVTAKIPWFHHSLLRDKVKDDQDFNFDLDFLQAH
jgi:hypothetical protein